MGWLRLIVCAALALLAANCGAASPGGETAVPANTPTGAEAQPIAGCPVTAPNGSTPPGETAADGYHGNGQLWTALWPQGTVLIGPEHVRSDGSLEMKFPWWRGVSGRLTIEGRRLDGPAPPLAAAIPDGYGDSGFQASGLIFPTAGCWEVTGSVGGATLTFVTLVTNI